jgi:glycosyltransferase involved in cell wall biosynthesis
LISILVPAYNAERLVEETLRSVLEQMGSRHELVVIDDGSRDGTAEVIERLQRAHPALALRLIRQDNQGLAITRNRLLDAATGDYILFVDADDVLLPGTLDALGNIVAAHQPDAIVCDFNDWYPDNPRRNRRIERAYPAGTLLRDREQFLRMFFVDRHFYACFYVLRREIYARQPAPLYPAGRAFEDVTVTPQLLADCGSVVRLAQPIINYRQHHGTMKRNVSHKWAIDFATAVRHVSQFYGRLALSDALRLHIDASVIHFYSVILKATYELAWRDGQATRASVWAMLQESLFHEVDTVLAAMEGGELMSRDPRADRIAAGQMRKILGGSKTFLLGKLISRRIKAWQRMIKA